MAIGPRMRWILVVTAALCLAGCGRAPTVARLKPDSVVLAFGDSLTFGSGVSEDRNYPAVLQGLLGCRVINGGNPGELSGEGFRRLPTVLERHQPSLVVLCHGGNDFLRRVPEAEVEANIRAMAGLARERGIDVILLGVPKPGLVLHAVGFYRTVASDLGIPYEGKVIARVLSTSSLKSDYVHPNEAGYRAIAESVRDLIGRSSR